MAIIESLSTLYTPPPIPVRGSVAFAVTASASFSPKVYSPFIRASVSFTVTAKAKFKARSRTERGLLFRVRAKAKFTPSSKLALTMPEPILPTSGNFRNGFFTARLYQNGATIEITSFNVSAPKDTLSMAISVQVAGFDRTAINPNGSFKFQIGHKENRADAYQWFTIADGAKLQSKNYSAAFLSDSLSFTASAEDNQRFNAAPPSPRIVYDSGKIQLSGTDAEILNTSTGFQITTQLINVANLNLYKLLNFAFVQGCGFSSIQTDLPNYEISRCDFPLTATYLESVSNYLRLWKPLFTVIGNSLRIQKKTTVPIDFEPEQITPDNYSTYSQDLAGRSDVDGIILEYSESRAEINIQANRTETTSEETGRFGESDYTRTDIVRQIRDYKRFDQPTVILKSEILSETRSTYDYQLNLIAREIETHSLDRQGRRTSSTRSSEGLVPNLNDNGAEALLKTREELISYSYKPDPRNLRRLLQNRAVTQIRGIVAVDSENTYFEEPFRQDFGEAHKAGNLRTGMTQEFAPMKTVTESLQTLGNGQTQVNVQTIDHLRNTIINSISETKSGEASLNGEISAPRKMVIYRSGYNKSRKHASLSVGELPLAFAEPLARLELDRITNGETNSSIEISGFDENLRRGTFLDVLDRAGETLGIHLTEGFAIDGRDLGTPKQRITTRIDAALIKRDE